MANLILPKRFNARIQGETARPIELDPNNRITDDIFIASPFMTQAAGDIGTANTETDLRDYADNVRWDLINSAPTFGYSEMSNGETKGGIEFNLPSNASERLETHRDIIFSTGLHERGTIIMAGHRQTNTRAYYWSQGNDQLELQDVDGTYYSTLYSNTLLTIAGIGAVPVTHASTWDATGAQVNQAAFLDGTERTRNAASTKVVPTDRPFTIAYSPGQNASRHFGGVWNYFFWWDRVLDNEEIASLYRDIWQLFRYVKPRVYVMPDAGGGPIAGSGSFAGTSAFQADGRRESSGSGAFAGTSAFQADGVRAVLGSGAFAGTATFQADAEKQVPGSASFAGTATFSGDAILAKAGSGAFAGSAIWTADARRIKRETGSFAGTSTLQGDGRISSGVSGAFAGTSAFSADGRKLNVYRDTASFAGTSTLSAITRVGGTYRGTGTFAGTSIFQSFERQVYRGNGVFAGSSIWSGNGIIPSQTIGPIDKPGFDSGSPQSGITSQTPSRGVIGSQGGL